MLIIDIGIAVKKIAAILQKYVFLKAMAFCLSQAKLPTAQSSAIVPARICMLIESAL